MDWDEGNHWPNEEHDAAVFERPMTMTPTEHALVGEWVKHPRDEGWADRIDHMAADIVDETMSAMDMDGRPEPCKKTFIDCISAGAYTVVQDANASSYSPVELVRALRAYAAKAVQGWLAGTCEECGH